MTARRLPGGELELRRLDPETADWVTMHALVRAAFDYMNGIIDPPSSANRLTPQALREKAGHEHALALFDGSLPVGCIFCDPRQDCLYVGKLAVSVAHQGQGIGRRLILAAESLAHELGYRELELQTRVELTGNHRYFASLGFIKTGETAHEGYARATSITMRKRISA